MREDLSVLAAFLGHVFLDHMSWPAFYSVCDYSEYDIGEIQIPDGI